MMLLLILLLPLPVLIAVVDVVDIVDVVVAEHAASVGVDAAATEFGSLSPALQFEVIIVDMLLLSLTSFFVSRNIVDLL